MPEKWTGEIAGLLHVHRIKQSELAAEAGYSEEYVSQIMNGAKTSRFAEVKLRSALGEIIKRKEKEKK